MSVIIPVFQIEVRYNFILNFVEFYRKLLSPYVKLSGSIKVENQNTLDERLYLNFEDDRFSIIISWDRIVFRGQGDLKTFTANNSPIEMPFLDILEKMTKYEEFGGVINILLAINFIKKLEIDEDDLYQKFVSKTMENGISKILDGATDAAIRIVKKSSSEEKSINFGPYFGVNDLKNRSMYPINLNSLGDLDFKGIMMEYKYLKNTSSFSFKEFVTLTEEGTKIFDTTWKSF